MSKKNHKSSHIPAWRNPELRLFEYWYNNLSTRNLYLFASNWIGPWFVTIVDAHYRLVSMIDNLWNFRNTSLCLHYLINNLTWLDLWFHENVMDFKWKRTLKWVATQIVYFGIFTYSVWMHDTHSVKLNDRHQCERSAF